MALKIKCYRCGIHDDTDRVDLRVGDEIPDHTCCNPFCIHGMGVVVEK